MTGRKSGVLLHISSLMGEYGIGTFGKEAKRFIDFLEQAGFHYWQVLPFTRIDACHSPYKSDSAFAGNLLFLVGGSAGQRPADGGRMVGNAGIPRPMPRRTIGCWKTDRLFSARPFPGWTGRCAGRWRFFRLRTPPGCLITAFIWPSRNPPVWIGAIGRTDR